MTLSQSLYEYLQERDAERDRLTRQRDRLPKQKLNTRKRLRAKRTEDNLEFQRRVGSKRSDKHRGKRDKDGPGV